MLAKKKFSRKEIKEDKLITTYYKAIDFFETNKTKILTGAIVVAAIVLGAVLYMNYKAGQNEKANVELSRVISIYESGQYLEAIEGRPGTKLLGLKKIVDEYGSTEAGETAKIYLANAYFFLGKLDDAYKFYEDYSGDNDLFKAAALAGEAGYKASKKEFEDAADLYLRASKVSKENAMNPTYIMNAGINYLDANKKEDAKELFQSIKKDYDDSPEAREVERYLVIVEG